MKISYRKPGELQVDKTLKILDSGLRASDARGIDAAKEMHELAVRAESSFRLLGSSGFAKESFESYYNQLSAIADNNDINFTFSDRNTLLSARRTFTSNTDAADFFRNVQDVTGNLINQGEDKTAKTEGMQMFGLTIGAGLVPTVITNNIINPAMIEESLKQAEMVTRAHEVSENKPQIREERSTLAEKALVAAAVTEVAGNSAAVAAESARAAEVVNAVALRQAAEISAKPSANIPAEIAESLTRNTHKTAEVELADKGEGAEAASRQSTGLAGLIKMHQQGSQPKAAENAPKLNDNERAVAEKLAANGVDIKALAGNLQASLTEKATPANGPSAADIQNHSIANAATSGRMV